eukprot:8926101-Ditylum_brightwellii.AAC.1
MSNLNCGLSSLALQFDSNAPKWLCELLASCTTVNAIRNAIADYDNVVQVAISTLECCIAWMQVNDGRNDKEMQTSDDYCRTEERRYHA